MWKPFKNIIVGINGCLSVKTLWTLITYYPMEGHSQQVNFFKCTKSDILHYKEMKAVNKGN